MTRQRNTRTARSPEHYDRILHEYESLGYTVVNDGEATTTLRYRDHGGVFAHAIILLFVGWWTAGLANLAYALYRRHESTHYVEIERPDP